MWYRNGNHGSKATKNKAIEKHLVTIPNIQIPFSRKKRWSQGNFSKSFVFFKPNIQLIKTQSSPSQLCTVPFTAFSKIDKLRDHEKVFSFTYCSSDGEFISAAEKL